MAYGNDETPFQGGFGKNQGQGPGYPPPKGQPTQGGEAPFKPYVPTPTPSGPGELPYRPRPDQIERTNDYVPPHPIAIQTPSGWTLPGEFNAQQDAIAKYQVHVDALLKDLNDRSSTMPMMFVRDAPGTVGGLLFAPLDSYGMKLLGQGLATSYPWLKQNAGVGGMFAAAYAGALQIQDRQMRMDALNMVKGMLQSSTDWLPQQQQAVLNQLSPESRGHLGPTSGESFAFFADGGIRVNVGPEGTVKSASIETKDVHDPRFLTAYGILQYLYPDVPVSGSAKGIEKVTEVAKNAIGLIGKPFDVVGKLATSVPGIGPIVGPAIGRFGDIIEAPTTTVFAGAGYIDAALHKAGVLKPNPGYQSIPVNPVDIIWPHQPGTALGNAFAKTFGIGPADPAYSNIVAVGSFISQWAAIGKTGEVARGARGSFRVPAGAEISPLDFTKNLDPAALATREMAEQSYGKIGGRVYEALSKTPEQWTSSTSGQSMLNLVHDVKLGGGDVVGNLQSEFTRVGMPIGMAKVFAETGNTLEELGTAYVNYVRRLSHGPPPEVVGALQTRLTMIDTRLAQDGSAEQAISESMGGPPIDPMERAAMTVEKATIQRKLASLPDAYNYPAFEFPRTSLARRLQTGASKTMPLTPLEETLGWLYNPPARWPNLSHMFDYLGAQLPIWNPFRADAPADALDRNADTIRTLGNRTGVPKAEIDRVISRMMEVTDSNMWKDWKENDVKGMFRPDATGRIAAKRLYPSAAQRIFQDDSPNYTFSERARIGVMDTALIDGNEVTIRRGILQRSSTGPDGTRVAYDSPSMESQMHDHYYLPTAQQFFDASSSTQNFLRQQLARKAAGESHLPLVVAVEKMRGYSTKITSVLRPATIYPRFASILIRSQGEQALRNVVMGKKAFVIPARELAGDVYNVPGMGPYIPSVRVDSLLPFESAADYAAKGIPSAQEFQQEMGIWVKRAYEPRSPRAPVEINSLRAPGILDDQATELAHQNLIMFRTSPSLRQLALHNDVDAFLKWYEGDTPAAEIARTNMDPMIESADVTKAELTTKLGHQPSLEEMRREWATKSLDSIHQIASNPDLQKAIWDEEGKWGVKFGDPVHYREVVNDMNVLTTQIAKARRMSGDAFGDPARYEEYQKAVALESELRYRRGALQNDLNNARITTSNVSLAKKEDFKAALEQAYYRGEWTPPARITGFKDVWTKEDIAAAHKAAVNERWYRGMGVATKLDMYLSRGSYYYQRATELQSHLESMGWTGKDATAAAAVKAAQDTADLHYNLTTRTSAQRFMKNLFWFEPVMQDIAYKWLVKIPSEYTWPVGAALLAQRAKIVIDLVKKLGWMRKDAQGHDVIIVPGVASFLQKALGEVPGAKFLGIDTLAPQAVRDIVSMYPQGLNIIGSGLPTLSAQYALPLNFAADHFTIVRHLAQILEPYGTDTTFGPAAATYAYEALTGKPPPWQIFSDSYQKQLHDLGFDDAIKQAVAESIHAGNDQPFPENFANDGAYQKAQGIWSQDIQNRARDIFKGWAFIRLVGSTVSPAALHVTDSYREDAYKTLNLIYGKPPPDYNSPAYADWSARRDRIQQDFLASHPGSVAYLVSKTIPVRGKPQLPYTNSADNGYYQGLIGGSRAVLSPEDFLHLVGYTESYRHFTGMKAQAVAAFGGASGVLRNTYLYHSTIDPINNEWRQYLASAEGQHGAAIYQDRVNAYAQASGDVPKYTFETQRVTDQLAFLRDTANALAVGGRRPQDIIKAYNYIVSHTQQTYGNPTTPLEKGMDWYFNTAVGPYYNQLGALYDQIGKNTGAGIDSTVLYDRVAQLKNEWNAKSLVGPDGKSYPSPEEVTWGNKPTYEQGLTQITWATRPVGWLSDFERGKVGYVGDSKKVDDFFHQAALTQQATQAYLTSQGISPNSAKYTQVIQAQQQQLDGLAASMGPEVAKLWDLNNRTPAERMQAVKLQGTDNPNFTAAVAYALWAAQDITNAGFSPSGYSQKAIQDKTGFFAAIGQLEKQDPVFRGLMDQAGQAVTVSRINPVSGSLLWNALFFGGFDSHVPQELQGFGGSTDPGITALSASPIQRSNSPTNLQTQGNIILQAPALASLLQVEQNLGYSINVVSSFRSYQQQANIYASGIRPAAPPGSSLHEQGLAIDVGNVTQVIRMALEQAGWYQFDPVNDPGHFSYGVRG